MFIEPRTSNIYKNVTPSGVRSLGGSKVVSVALRNTKPMRSVLGQRKSIALSVSSRLLITRFTSSLIDTACIFSYLRLKQV